MRATRLKRKMADSSDRKKVRAPAKKKLPARVGVMGACIMQMEPCLLEQVSSSTANCKQLLSRPAEPHAPPPPARGRRTYAAVCKVELLRRVAEDLHVEMDQEGPDHVLVGLADALPQAVVALHDLVPLDLGGRRVGVRQPVRQQPLDGARLGWGERVPGGWMLGGGRMGGYKMLAAHAWRLHAACCPCMTASCHAACSRCTVARASQWRRMATHGAGCMRHAAACAMQLHARPAPRAPRRPGRPPAAGSASGCRRPRGRRAPSRSPPSSRRRQTQAARARRALLAAAGAPRGC